MKEKLIEFVIDQFKEDMQKGDLTAIYELLDIIDIRYLLGFLSEEKQKKYLTQSKRKWHNE
jgi:hypothetical protein